MKNNKNSIIIIIVLIILLGIGGYFIYNRVTDENNSLDVNDSFSIESILEEKASSYQSVESYLENYMNYIPWKYENSKLKDININNLSSDRISYTVLRYILENSKDTISPRKMSIEEVNDFLKEYYDLDNYQVQELKIDENNMFELRKKDGVYEVEILATEFSFPTYEISKVNYDNSYVSIDFKTKNDSPLTDDEVRLQFGKLTLKYNNGNFNFQEIEFENLKMNMEE